MDKYTLSYVGKDALQGQLNRLPFQLAVLASPSVSKLPSKVIRNVITVSRPASFLPRVMPIAQIIRTSFTFYIRGGGRAGVVGCVGLNDVISSHHRERLLLSRYGRPIYT